MNGLEHIVGIVARKGNHHIKTGVTLAENHMKNYNITVTRISYSCADFKVKAKNIEKAKMMAIEMAGNYVFDEHEADYKIEFAQEDVPEEK